MMFEQWPTLHRIEATTRQDNLAMRGVFQKCGFTQEGHLRKSWKADNNKYYATILCGILREDWETGNTSSIQSNDKTKIRRALPEESQKLSELALRSKSHWPYDKDYLQKSATESKLQPESFLPLLKFNIREDV